MLTRWIVAGLIAARTVALPAQAPACSPPAIDSTGMIHDLFRLADDSMRGRLVGSPGNHKARDFIAARFDALGLDRIRGGRIQPFSFASRGNTTTGYNVAGFVRGSSVPDSYIVVSAHFDHIGVAGSGQCRPSGADSICNGADDNASGTAGLLALARHFSQHPATHSILFLAFDAEESGDVGSKAWVDSATVPLSRILVDVNMDMVGRNAKNQLYAAGPHKYPALAPLVDATAQCATTFSLLIGHDTPTSDDWTDQSDQGAFHAHGIPFVYFGEEDHPDYHRATDHADRLMPAFYAAAVRAVGDFVHRFDMAPARR